MHTVPNFAFGHVFNKCSCAFNMYSTCVLHVHVCTCSKVMMFIMGEGYVAITLTRIMHATARVIYTSFLSRAASCVNAS